MIKDNLDNQGGKWDKYAVDDSGGKWDKYAVPDADLKKKSWEFSIFGYTITITKSA